ncbi:MAG: hypothetical protein A2Y33_07470 [Spirochaetes bacterium GWF1_51_8]|nr:MAG: hypothetical protein A2Y33_07470 [Spirochaetes bacterium GWF1_51_8]
MKSLFGIIFTAAIVCAAAGVLSAGAAKKPVQINLKSPSFTNMGAIPVTFSCDGSDIPPALYWYPAPKGVKSYVLICDDPDAPGGTWVHWVLYNIPPTATNTTQGMADKSKYNNGMMSAKNSWGAFGYGGPCPPSGTHRYFFKLYALDIAPKMPMGSSLSQIKKAMKGHIIGYGELIGTFKR